MDVVLTILVITAIAAVRSFVAPTDGESVRNVAVPLGAMLQGLEQRMPILSLVVWAVVIFIAGINTGRYGVKYSLYPAYTLMAIPVFGIVAAGVMVSHDYLVTAASALCVYAYELHGKVVERVQGGAAVVLRLVCHEGV